MKRYLVFAGEYYYPTGGWDDFVGDYDDLEDATAAGKNPGHDGEWHQWWHVIDSETGVMVVEDTVGAQQRSPAAAS